eukprot:15430320-Alexandrium_andersonii.AAC.1
MRQRSLPALIPPTAPKHSNDNEVGQQPLGGEKGTPFSKEEERGGPHGWSPLTEKAATQQQGMATARL